MEMPVSDSEPRTNPQSELTDEQRQELLEQAIERKDRLAQSELEMARLFLANGKTEIVKRRLQTVVKQYGSSEAAAEARKMLRKL